MHGDICEAQAIGGSFRAPSLTERLAAKRKALEDELSLVRKAEETLDKNPDLKELFDIVSKVRGI